MDRRTFITGALAALPAGLLGSQLFAFQGRKRVKLQFCMLELGQNWNKRKRALVQLGFEIQKRCNIPIESDVYSCKPNGVAEVHSPFFILSGDTSFETPGQEDAGRLRLVLNAGGMLLIDDFSPKGETGFYDSAKALMRRVYPEAGGSAVVPVDHALYQSYYLLKEPRGRLNRKNYLEGWSIGNRTTTLFSHNDLLGALEADRLGNWQHNMELGGGFRRELCFRLGINLTYYALTLNYKKDRAFPPVIERRRRL